MEGEERDGESGKEGEKGREGREIWLYCETCIGIQTIPLVRNGGLHVVFPHVSNTLFFSVLTFPSPPQMPVC